MDQDGQAYEKRKKGTRFIRGSRSVWDSTSALPEGASTQGQLAALIESRIIVPRVSEPRTHRCIISANEALVREHGMKNLFENETVGEVIERIDGLEPEAQRQWGRMDVAQMLAHCAAVLDMAAGRINPPRMLIGRILGPFVKPVYVNEKPFPPNSPTEKKLVVSDSRDFSREREHLKDCVREFQQGGEAKCTRHPHPFFGSLTPAEWSRGMYKHLDHHLRQFGA